MHKSTVWRMAACPIASLMTVVMLLAAGDCAAQIRDKKHPAAHPGPTRPELILNLGHGDLLRDFAFSPDGGTLASGSGDGTIKVWDVQSGSLLRTLSGHAGWVTAVAISPDGSTLVSGSTDVTTKLWDLATGRLLHTWSSGNGNVEAVAFSPDGQTVACAGSFTITLWDVPTRKQKRRLAGHDYGLSALAFSPDGRILVSGGERRADHSSAGELKFWDVQTGTLQRTVPNFDRNGIRIAFSPDGRTLAFGATERVPPRGDGTDATAEGVAQGRSNYVIHLWDVTAKQVRQTLRGAEFSIYSLAFSADGGTLVSGDMYNMVRVWDTATGAQRHALRVGSQINPVAISPDGKTVASTGQGRGDIRLSDAETGGPLHLLPGRRGGVGQIAISPDGRTLAHSHAIGARDGTVRLWDMRTARLTQTRAVPGYVSMLFFGVNHKTLAAGIRRYGDEKPVHQIWWWSLPSGALHRRVSQPQPVLSFAPDGRTVATGAWSGPVQLWNVFVPSGSQAKPLALKVKPGVGTSGYAVFTPDGAKVAIGGWDSAVRVWDVKSGRLAATIQDPINTANSVETVAFAPRSGRWAAGYSWGPVNLRESLQPPIKRVLGYSDPNFLAFSRDGATLIVGDRTNTAVTLWSAASGRRQRTIQGLGGPVRAVTHTPAGLVLAVLGQDGAITLWSAATGRGLVTLWILPGRQGQSSTEWIAYTPAGYYDASPGAEEFIRWRVGNKMHAAAQYRSAFHRPALLQKALSTHSGVP